MITSKGELVKKVRSSLLSLQKLPSKVRSFFQKETLSLTLANFAGSSAARDSKHRIVLDDLMSAFEHEFHASHVAKSCPAAFHI